MEFHPRTLMLRTRCVPPTPQQPDPFPLEEDRSLALGVLLRVERWGARGVSDLTCQVEFSVTLRPDLTDIVARLVAQEFIEPHDASRFEMIAKKKYPWPHLYSSSVRYVLTVAGAVYLVAKWPAEKKVEDPA